MSGRLLVWLRSASKRRAEWLNQRFQVDEIELICQPLLSEEDAPPTGVDVRQQVESILAGKIESALLELRIAEQGVERLPDVVLVADTLVEDPDDAFCALGQPADRISAAGQLMRLSGRRHLVWSGTALITAAEAGWNTYSTVESAVVEINDLSTEILAKLLDSESWVGKAGGYDLGGQMGEHGRLVEGEEVCVLGFATAPISRLDNMVRG